MKSSVLLAACEPEILQSLPLVLLAAGHRVQIAASGLDVLKKARHRRPGLIILDATLPDMDGTTVCEILRCLPSTTTVPTILLAARPIVFPQPAAIRGGSAEGVLAPLNTEDLLRRVNQMLAPKTAPPETMAEPDAAWETRAGFA